MRILVTGGCGFIGSNFINYMFEKYEDIEIINIDKISYCSDESFIHREKYGLKYKFIKSNINNYELLMEIFKAGKIDVIYHFAAQTHVDNSYSCALDYSDDNIKGTHVLLEAIKNSGIIKHVLLLHFSTDEVYGETIDDDYKTELSILCPTNPYAATKAAAEMLVNSYKHSYGLKCIITRSNNVYGRNQHVEKLLPRFISLLRVGKKCTIHGDGSSLRSFIHVDDVCCAVDTVVRLGSVGKIYNIGSESNNELTVLQVAALLVKIMFGEECDVRDYIEFVGDRPFNDKRYFISADKIKRLGWKQTKNIMDIKHISEIIE